MDSAPFRYKIDEREVLQIVLLGIQYLFAHHLRMPKVVRMGALECTEQK